MTGHQRMVPYGYNLLKQSLAGHEYDIFSYTWFNDTETRPVIEIPGTQDTIQLLGDRSVHVDQKPIIQQYYNMFLEQNAISTQYNPSHLMPQQTFTQFFGQVLSLLLAVDKWYDRLKTYDVIIKSRWDVLIDPLQISQVRDKRLLVSGGIYINNGQTELGGDVTLCYAKDYLPNLYPLNTTIDKLIQIVKDKNEHSLEYMAENDEFFRTGKWFNSHFLWASLFKNNHNLCIEGHYCSPRIVPELTKYAPDKITLNDVFDHMRANPIYA